MPQSEDVLVTAVQARNDFGIPTDRIRRWSHAGTATPRGTLGRFKLYSLSELKHLNSLAEFDPRARKSA